MKNATRECHIIDAVLHLCSRSETKFAYFDFFKFWLSPNDVDRMFSGLRITIGKEDAPIREKYVESIASINEEIKKLLVNLGKATATKWVEFLADKSSNLEDWIADHHVTVVEKASQSNFVDFLNFIIKQVPAP